MYFLSTQNYPKSSISMKNVDFSMKIKIICKVILNIDSYVYISVVLGPYEL